MKIFDTKTRQLEKFKPLSSSQVKVYYCGPTVYNYAHIGNLKTSVVEDIVVKTLKFLGYNLKVTMNITDVDDKTIRDSIKAGETLKNFTEKYTKVFFEDLHKLGVERPDVVEPVTNIIPEMVRMIQTMINRGYAYYADDGSIYYNISKFKKYGQLAHLDISGMKSSVRIDNDEYDKEHAADFVLWKAWRETDGENFWEESFDIPTSVTASEAKQSNSASDEKIASSLASSQGRETKKVVKGRPGWHIECSACAMKHLGQQIDIHMGGEDLIFPHHQNEIAQSEACTGKEFSKYWIHSGHLMVGGKKMSKSLGNFYNLQDLEKEFSQVKPSVLYRAVRLSFMNGNYRETIDFSFEKLKQLLNTIKNIDTSYRSVVSYTTDIEGTRKEFSGTLQEYITGYIEALENDFSIPLALASFFEFQKYTSGQVHAGELSKDERQSVIDMYHTFNQVLGIVDTQIASDQQIPQEILDMSEQRDEAKKQKDYNRADILRSEIESQGYTVKDSREGTTIEKA